MKVALVESVPFPPAEGLGNYVWNLARELDKLGHDVQIFTRGASKEPKRSEHEGIEIIEAYAPYVPPIHVHVHGRHLQRAFDAYASQVDLVHMHAPLPAPIRSKAPQLLTFHTPIKSSVANLATWDRSAVLQRLQSPIAQTVERSLIRRAALVSAVSRSVAEDLGAYGLDPKEIRVIDNGIDPTIFKPGTKPREDFLLVTGRVAPRKGLPDLLEAVALLKKQGRVVKLVITGKGPLRPHLEAQARRLGIDQQVDFRGFVTRDELVSLLQRCALYVFPSHYEGLPTSVLEAMACGAPVVAAAAHGTVDVVEEGVTGRLVPVGKPERLAAAVAATLAADEERRTFGAAARDAVKTRYAWDRVAAGIESVYREIKR